MQVTTDNKIYQFLKFIAFKDLEKWYVSYYINPYSIKSEFPLVRIGDLIKPKKIKIKKTDFKNDIDIVSKISFSDGKIHIREDRKTGMDLYDLAKGDLLVSKINFHQGALAINDIGTLVCSTHYQPYVFKDNRIDPDFFIKVVRSNGLKNFLNYLRAEGIKNEATYEFIGDIEIPLPTLSEQEEILSEYNAKMQEVERLEMEIELLKKTYDDIFFAAFSIERPKPIVKKTGLQFVPFSTISRWDALSSNFIYTDALKSSAFNLIPLGFFAKFISRSWNKKAHTADTFNYIELGGVNPDLGIETYSTLDKKEAPSRATQTVKDGDLIIGTTRPYLKRFAIVQEEHNDFVCSSGFSVIEPTEEVNLHFLKYYLMSCFGEEQLSNNMSGALYPAITSKSLMEDIYIPEIDIEQQNEIANQILTINEKIKQNYRKIDETKKEALTDFEAKIFKN